MPTLTKKVREQWQEDADVMFLMYACGFSEWEISKAFGRHISNVRRMLYKTVDHMRRHKTGAWVDPHERQPHEAASSPSLRSAYQKAGDQEPRAKVELSTNSTSYTAAATRSRTRARLARGRFLRPARVGPRV